MMPRRSVSLPAPAWEWLESEAARLGISVPDVLRRLIDKARKA